MSGYDPKRNRRVPGSSLQADGAPEPSDAAPVDALLDRTGATVATPSPATASAEPPATASAEPPATASAEPPERVDDERTTGAVAAVTIPLPLPPGDDAPVRKALTAGAAGTGVGVLLLWWYVSRRRRRGR